MTEGIVIRRGTSADLHQVMQVAQESERAAQWPRSTYDEIFTTRRVLLVAEDRTEIVGFLVAHDIAGEWELENVAVKPDHQGRGIGKTLVNGLISEADKNTAKSVFLEVRESNSAAKHLYESCGFEQCGRRKDYYHNPSEDGLLYRFLCNPKSLENC